MQLWTFAGRAGAGKQAIQLLFLINRYVSIFSKVTFNLISHFLTKLNPVSLDHTLLADSKKKNAFML